MSFPHGNGGGGSQWPPHYSYNYNADSGSNQQNQPQGHQHAPQYGTPFAGSTLGTGPIPLHNYAVANGPAPTAPTPFSHSAVPTGYLATTAPPPPPPPPPPTRARRRAPPTRRPRQPPPPPRTYTPIQQNIQRPPARDPKTDFTIEEDVFIVWANSKWPGSENRGRRAVGLEEWIISQGLGAQLPRRSIQTVQERFHYKGGIRMKEKDKREADSQKPRYKDRFEAFFRLEGDPPQDFPPLK